MTTEQLIANYSPVGDMITMIICWIILYIIIKVLYFTKEKKFVFLKRAVHFVLFGTGANIAFYLVIEKGVYRPSILFLLRDVYHISFLCCLYCFVLYMKKMLDVKGTAANVVTYLTRVLFCICLLLDVFSQHTRLGLYLQDDGLWGGYDCQRI